MRTIALTPGEPAGIGPDIIVSISQRPHNANLVIISDPDLLLERARLLGHTLKINEYKQGSALDRHQPGQLTVLPYRLERPAIPGKPDPKNAQYVLSSIDRAVDGCLEKEFSAIVTGPVHKAVINQAGIPFTGHTEYIARRCGNVFPVMMLMNQYLRVALITTHIPLAAVSASINQTLVETVIKIVNYNLIRDFGIKVPRIMICGLNPHAGEQGYLGHEEQEHIEPVIKKLRHNNLDLIGPVPADTAFTDEALAGIDAIICMYHDQGLPVLKSRGFSETVNITLGLPIIRTSVDHGTAFSLAGTGRAKDSSLLAAIECALTLAKNRQA